MNYSKVLQAFEISMIDIGLKESTIRKHMRCVDFFVLDYLKKFSIQSHEESIILACNFLDKWLAENTFGLSSNMMKEHTIAIKKYYKFLLDRDLLEQQSYNELLEFIKKNKNKWVAFDYTNENRGFDDVMNRLMILEPWKYLRAFDIIEVEERYSKYYVTCMDKSDAVEIMIYNGKDGINCLMKIMGNHYETSEEFSADFDVVICSLEKNSDCVVLDIYSLKRGYDKSFSGLPKNLFTNIVSKYVECLEKYDLDFNSLDLYDYYRYKDNRLSIENMIQRIGYKADKNFFTAKEIGEVQNTSISEFSWVALESYGSVNGDMVDINIEFQINGVKEQIVTHIENYEVDVTQYILLLIKKYGRPKYVVSNFSCAKLSLKNILMSLNIETKFENERIVSDSAIEITQFAIKGSIKHSLKKSLLMYDEKSIEYIASILHLPFMDKVSQVEKICKTMSSNSFELIVGTLPEESYAYFIEHIWDNFDKNNNEFVLGTRALKEKALLFQFVENDDNYYVIPDEIKASYQLADKERMESFRHNYLMIATYIEACVNLYGVIREEKLVDWLLEDIDIDEKNLLFYMNLFSIQNNHIYYMNDLCMLDFFVEEPELIEEILHEKPYYRPEVDELLKYKNCFYVEETPAFLALKDFLNQIMELKNDELDDVLSTIYYCAEFASFDELISILESEGIEFTDHLKERFLGVYRNFTNHFRTAINHGFTPFELRQGMK